VQKTISILLAAAFLAGCGGSTFFAVPNPAQAQTATAVVNNSGEPSLLFVQNATSGSLVALTDELFEVTLEGSDSTLFFQDRPGRSYGVSPTADFVDNFATSFAGSDPNGVLEYQTADGLVILPATFSNPSFSNGQLTYRATTLAAIPSSYTNSNVSGFHSGSTQFGQASLFLDNANTGPMPMSEISVDSNRTEQVTTTVSGTLQFRSSIENGSYSGEGTIEYTGGSQFPGGSVLLVTLPALSDPSAMWIVVYGETDPDILSANTPNTIQIGNFGTTITLSVDGTPPALLTLPIEVQNHPESRDSIQVRTMSDG
jgi:hypothetical protein